MSKYTYGRTIDAAVEEYSLGLTRCNCGGLGFVRATIWDADLQRRVPVPLGHPLFGKAIPCVCKRQQEARAQAERMREMSGATAEDLRAATFEAFDPSLATPPSKMHPDAMSTMRDIVGATKRQCEAFASQPADRWLVIVGNYGTGKTHLALAITGHSLAMGRQATFAAVPDLLDSLRSGYAEGQTVRYEERLRWLQEVDLLVLDDFGVERATEWAAEKLFQVLNARYAHRLPLVVTTNLDFRRNEKAVPSRLRSRLLDADRASYVDLPCGDFRRRRML